MTHIDRQIDLLTLDDLDLALVLFHVHSHEFIADFWSVFSSICGAELLLLKLYEVFRFRLGVILFAFPPSYFIQTFAEENDESQHSLVERIIDLFRDIVQVQGENFINKHLELLLL